MDILAELEALASELTTAPIDLGENVSDGYIERWRRLFGYSYSESITHIQEHRSDINRGGFSEEH
jgi:hypothetical protein